MKQRNMKRNSLIITALAIVLFLTNCQQKKTGPAAENMVTDTVVSAVNVTDTTVYGICGEGTSMHSLQLVNADGDTLYYQVDVDEEADVKGGMMVGDHLAVLGYSPEKGEEQVAQRIINLTTLAGKWSSIDRCFEIQEGGMLLSDGKEAQMGEWKICNGLLVLKSDTFSIYGLGADSLYLENEKGIYAYKRIK